MRGFRAAMVILLLGWTASVSGPARAEPPPPSDKAESSKAQSGQSAAGNEQVAEIMRTFEGRGVQSDGSSPTPPGEALQSFRLKNGVQIELVASEPEISQPLHLSWDSRGRMWVVQYRQYQYPAGLKVVRYDQHLRAVFDKTPLPPPHGPRGNDVITVFEDTDGDGCYDHHQDVIKGLNIATSVQAGNGGIWVLNPPYLLFYPDANGDDVPDADPEVHLSGFGLQDTHAVANNLLLAPDGWLYGANGSTTTGKISSQVTKDVEFQGQCVWRYHPTTRVFEIYAEGGGNTFALEFDAGGRIFVGHNGGRTRGWYLPQGSYSRKNWGKHGPLTNPYAFGFFEAMSMKGDTRRFPQALCIYEGGLFDPSYRGDIIAANSLHNLVWHDEKIRDGSTYRTEPHTNLVESSDRWFRPVFVGVGPDGAVYLADWYDTRLSHVSPIDDWHKESGRVYRLKPQHTTPVYSRGDLAKASPAELIRRFDDPNRWVRHRASLELGWRGDRSIVDTLVAKVDRDGSLEALWTLNRLGELSSQRGASWLRHSDSDIRRWTVRLLGDRREGHPDMIDLAADEAEVQVRSQLASTAKRIPASMAVPLLKRLIGHDEDASDPHVPLLIWWAVEAHAEDFDAIESMLRDEEVWARPIFRQTVASRLIERYASVGGQENLQRCARLFTLAPHAADREILLQGLTRAFEGLPMPELPTELQRVIEAYQESVGESDLVLSLRSGSPDAVERAIAILGDSKHPLAQRVAVAKTLGQVPAAEALPALMRIATGASTSEPSLQRVALQAVRSYDNPAIAEQLLAKFDSSIAEGGGVRDAACRTLASRRVWAKRFLQDLSRWRVNPSDVPADVVQQLRTYQDPEIVKSVERIFGHDDRESTPAVAKQMTDLRSLLRRTEGDWRAGRKVYRERCGKCHQLFGEGQNVGPKLDGYERGKPDFWSLAIMDPSAEIREGYQSYLALTSDGRVINGMIETQSERTVTLRDADGHRSVLDRSDLDEFRALPTSLMPSGTLDGLNEQGIADLFAYLMREKKE